MKLSKFTALPFLVNKIFVYFVGVSISSLVKVSYRFPTAFFILRNRLKKFNNLYAKIKKARYFFLTHQNLKEFLDHSKAAYLHEKPKSNHKKKPPLDAHQNLASLLHVAAKKWPERQRVTKQPHK
ncbi:MAG: hypothetical protein AAF443_05325 [Chlamydiota bacterium]